MRKARFIQLHTRYPYVQLRYALLFLVLSLLTTRAAASDPIQYVDPHIGTGGNGGHGGTMPFVTAPFGMTNWTAQTRLNKISMFSYSYEDRSISGFIGTHQPAIWMGDYGYVTLMPEVGEIKVTAAARKLPFRHQDEVTTPYYYSVEMSAGNSQTIKTQITATERCAMLVFAFPHDKDADMLIEATREGVRGFVRIDPDAGEIVGYNPDRMDAHLGPLSLPNFKGYFVVQFKNRFDRFGTFTGAKLHPDERTATDNNVGAYATWSDAADRLIEAKVGTSFISIEQARENLKREIKGWNFEAVRSSLRDQWNRKLRMFEIDASEGERKIFYTGLYHALLYPRIFSEYGRYYSAFDDQIHNGTSYTAYSLWDTFRAENSLLTLVAPERIDGMVNALLQNYKEGGWMPKWPNPSYTNIMIGTHADSVLAEAIVKGFHGFDYKVAYEAAYKDAMVPPEGDTTRRWFDREPHTPYEARAGLTFAKKLGYIPADKTAESASSTLEEAYDDYCVAQVAKAAGDMNGYRFFMNRSHNYKNVYDPQTGFMRARNSDGSWADPKEGWTEGDKWTYSWSVLHDVPGLVTLMGGTNAFNAKLDEHFRAGHNLHSNEPSHHYAYLYDYSGKAWKTQAKVREVATESYTSKPDGLIGDEDCGQMSAWYIFSALGFYPVNPASGEYMIGSPLFRSATLNLSNGKRFVISARNNSAVNVYIQSAMLNGKPLRAPVISHKQILSGGKLTFVMGPRPSRWASDWKPSPVPSFGKAKTPAPIKK